MGVDTSNANAALKIRYAKGLQRVLYDDKKVTPFYARVARKKMNAQKSAFGQSFVIGTKWSDQQTAYVDYTTGYNIANGATAGGYSEYVNFVVPATLKYGFARVSGPAMVQSDDGTEAFVDLGAEELDGQLRVVQRSHAATCFGTGFGGRGTIQAITATTITLTLKEDVANLAANQLIVASASESGNVLRATLNTGNRITKVNPSTATLTVAGDATATWAAGDTIFVYKDREDSATPTKQIWFGVAGWIPITAPSGGDSWCGLDRSASPQLHGHRYDGQGGAILDVLNDASQWGLLQGCTPSAVYMNPMDIAKILKVKESARHIPLKGSNADVGFSGIEFHGANGDIPILGDAGVKKGRAYFLDEESWFVAYSGDDVVHVVDNNGLIYQQVAGADAYYAAARSISNLVCKDPGANMVVSNFV